MKLINLVTAANLAEKLHANINVYNNTYFYNCNPDTANNPNKKIVSRSTHNLKAICSLGYNSVHGVSLVVATHDDKSAAHFLGAVRAIAALTEYALAQDLMYYAEAEHKWIRLQDEQYCEVEPVAALGIKVPELALDISIVAEGNHIQYKSAVRTLYPKFDYMLIACYTVWQWLCRHPNAHVKTQLGPLLTAATLTGVHA